MNRRPLVVVFGAFLAFVMAFIPVAWAADFDNMRPTATWPDACYDSEMSSDPTICQTDNATVTIFREASISATGVQEISQALTGWNNTDLQNINQSPPSYSGDAETDIIYRQGSLPFGTLGRTWCDDSISSTKCDQHYVQFYDDTPWRSLACHETGHAYGLTHGNDAYQVIANNDSRLGCMRSPNDVSYTLIGPHNVDNVNATY